MFFWKINIIIVVEGFFTLNGIGMQIGAEHKAKGYGTAAIRILLKYAFLERRLNKYNCSILERNIGSSTILKKLGSVQEGVRRQQVYSDGRYMDVILFGLTKEDFIKNEEYLNK
jgi:RimJ/RimL family protein N-acetyltransferase